MLLVAALQHRRVLLPKFQADFAVLNLQNIYTARTLAWATESRLGEIEYFSMKEGSRLGHSFSLRRDRFLHVEGMSRLGDHVLA